MAADLTKLFAGVDFLLGLLAICLQVILIINTPYFDHQFESKYDVIVIRFPATRCTGRIGQLMPSRLEYGAVYSS